MKAADRIKEQAEEEEGAYCPMCGGDPEDHMWGTYGGGIDWVCLNDPQRVKSGKTIKTT